MNAPNLSRRLATRIIEGLNGRGRISVVKGGTSALIRAVDDAISSPVALIANRFEHQHSSPDDPQTLQLITQLTHGVAQTLFSSEHLEDVFADRSVVERQVFDTTRLAFQEESEDERDRVMHVEIDMLGYVAATAGKLASEDQVTVALERAADAVGAQLSAYDPSARAAIFVPGPEPVMDLRLELEEAVADELSSLVSAGAIVLPVLERTRPLQHRVDPTAKTRLQRPIDRIATRTLRRTGCSARWDFADDRNIRVIFTPLSEQDARDVDTHVSAFTTEVEALMSDIRLPLMTDPLPKSPTATKRHDVGISDPESDTEITTRPKRTARAGGRAKVPPRAAPKRVVTKRTSKRTEAATEKVVVRKKPVATKKKAPAAKKVRGS